MALMIDTPLWPWRGRLWAHMISDESLDELHAGARTLGLRWLSFGRDHYDVPDTMWEQACELAQLVDSRVIVRSLRSSGLRVHGGKAKKAWKWQPEFPREHATEPVLDWLEQVASRLDRPAIEFLSRPGETVVLHLLDTDQRPDLGDLVDPPVGADRVVETVADGRYSVELILEKQSPGTRSITPTRPLL